MHGQMKPRPGYCIRFTVALTWLVLAAVGLLVSGCGVQPLSLPSPLPTPAPAPTQPPAPTPPPASTPVPRERVTQPAALSLLRSAEQALAASNPRKADDYLERAVRIDPHNPKVWHALARSKFQQKQYPQTIQMSLKSNSFRPDRATERSNWLLMEQAYLAMDDVRNAEKAKSRADD